MEVAIKFFEEKVPKGVFFTAYQTISDENALFSILFDCFYYLQNIPGYPEKTIEISLTNWLNDYLSSDQYKKIKNLKIDNSWKNGLALCALIHRFNPKCLNFDSLNPFDSEANVRLAIYAANVLLNFDNFIEFEDLNDTDKNELILLVYEIQNAIKVAEKIPKSNEIVSEIIGLFVKEEELTKIAIKEKKDLEFKIKALKSFFKSLFELYDNSGLLNRRPDIDMKPFYDIEKRVFSLEKMNFDSFLISLKLNSKKLIQNSINKFKSENNIVNQFNELEELCHKLKNEKNYQTNLLNSLEKIDNKHLKLTKDIINWVENVRLKIFTKSESKTMQDIINEINYYKSMNIEIISKRNSFQNELSRLENYLERHKFQNFKQTKDRISLMFMFEVVNKDWLEKINKLRKRKVLLEKDYKIKELFSLHEHIYVSTENKIEQYKLHSISRFEANSLIEAKRIVFDIKFNKIRLKKNIKINMNKIEEIEKEIYNLSNNSILFDKKAHNKLFLEKRKKFIKIEEDYLKESKNALEKIAVLIQREFYKEKISTCLRNYKNELEMTLNITKKKIKDIESIKTDSYSLEEVYEKKSKLNVSIKLIKYEMDKKLELLEKMETYIIEARFTSELYPEYEWRFDNNPEKDFSLIKERKIVIEALAQLSSLCNNNLNKIYEKIKKFEKIDEQRIRFSALVDEFINFSKESKETLNNESLPHNMRKSIVIKKKKVPTATLR